MKKIFGRLLLLICIVSFCFVRPTSVQADYFTDDTLVYTHYNDKADYYGDLSDIKEIALNEKYICYTLSDNIYLLNKTTKAVDKILGNITTIDNVVLTSQYLFIQSGTDIYTYNLQSRLSGRLYTDLINSTVLSGYNDYAISEANDKIVVACISDSTFVAHFYSSDTLKYINSYTNPALQSEITSTGYNLLNIATNNSYAYIINNSTNSDENTLWKVRYDMPNNFDKALFTKPDIQSLAVYTYTNNNSTHDYLIAVDINNSIYVHRTDFTEYNSDKEYADDIITKSLADSRFVANDISTAEDITIYNGNVYISDSGTKCIQEFTFNKLSDKASISGTKVVVASECGEIGRFGKDSNLQYTNNNLIISDTNNKRVQVITNGVITSYNKDTLGINADQLENLTQSYICGETLYIMSNNKIGNQNIYVYNLTTHTAYLKENNIEKALDSTISDNNIYIVSTNGIFMINTISGEETQLLDITLTEDCRIAYLLDNQLVVTSDRQLSIYEISNDQAIKKNSTTLATSVIDITSIDNSIYLLDATNRIIRYDIESNDNVPTLRNEDILTFTNSQYVSISIDQSSGILYAFDNTACKIDKIINPTFNFLENSGLYQVNNKNVSIYYRPYFLNGIDSPSIVKTLDVNTRINVFSKTSINYGNIDYYIVELENGEYGYINIDDLTYLSDVINYEIIHPNASIRAFDDTKTVNIYSAPSFDSDIIATPPVGTRIYIAEYNSADEFSLVRYYDNDQKLVEGYIANNLVDSDSMSQSQLIALILIGCCIILLIAILITIHIVKKRRITKHKNEQ
ncbi:MAG: hypothetical protein E7361_00210 [Clostridiales bacterium]|nr:hypothetical protein [Clostridiales bacterium]